MSHPGAGGPSYDSDQVAAILRAAAEMDNRTAVAGPAPGGGMSLSEIQQVAQEVGISPAAVEIASLQLNAPSPSPLSHRLQRVRHLQGELPTRRTEELLHALRTVVGPRGEVRSTSSGVEVDLPRSDLGAVRMVIRSAAGSTTVTLWSETSKAREAGLTGSLLGMFGSAGLAANAPGAAVMAAAGFAGIGALFAAGAGVGLGVGLGLWRLGARRWRHRVVDLQAEVARVVEAFVERAPPPSEEP